MEDDAQVGSTYMGQLIHVALNPVLASKVLPVVRDKWYRDRGRKAPPLQDEII